MPSTPNPKQAWVADIKFLLSECVRLRELTQRVKPWNLSKADVLGTLPSPTGIGNILCGAEALYRLHGLATVALKQSGASGTVEPEKVFRALKQIVVQRFIKERRPLDIAQVERALAAAAKEAKRSRSDAVHYIPCRLMQAKDPSTFSVGPVTFRERVSFDHQMEGHYATYLETGATLQQIEMGKFLLPHARHYYEGFTWIAEVKILNCDEEISKERAYLAVTAALDCLHLLFGAYHTDRMTVGGPRLAEDRRAHLHLDANGALQVSCSSSFTSAGGFKDGWGEFFAREDIAFFLHGAGKAIEPLVNPTVERPVGMRFIDAVTWFGQAAREISDAARIVKAVNALERLVMTGEREGISELLSQRAAAVCHDPEHDKFFDDIAAKLKDAYDLRSKLVHGSLSPFAPEVKDNSSVTMRLVETALRGGLLFFESEALVDRICTDAQLAKGFGNLLEWAATDCAAGKNHRG
jgi:hypothetical protein